MNNNHINNDVLQPILDYYHALPPISRSWFTLALSVTALHTLEFFPDETQLIFDFHLLLPPHLELWRVLTSFSWCGPGTLVDFHVLMLLCSMGVVVPEYEKDPLPSHSLQLNLQQSNNNTEHERRRRRRHPSRHLQRSKHPESDCLFAFLTCIILILASYLLVTETSLLPTILNRLLQFPPKTTQKMLQQQSPLLIPIFTRTLLYSLITLHSIRHPTRQVNINFFPVKGRYVPLFHLGFGILMGYRINEMVHGIAIGFVYASLVEFDGWLANWVGKGGERVIYTPNWLVLLVEGHQHPGMIEVRNQSDESTNPNNNGYDVQSNDDRQQAHRLNPRQQFIQYHVGLEPGANILHRAAALGNLQVLQHELDRAQRRADDCANAAITSNNDDDVPISTPLFNETEMFRQQDRNGWQPLHEASRGGHVSVIEFLLELEQMVEREERINDDNNQVNQRRWRRKLRRKLNIDINSRTNHGTGCTALWLAENEHGQQSEIANMIRAVGGISLGYGDADDNTLDDNVNVS
ncbi:hypothetical protein ACHAXS_004102 [Conticribra weissflogii]